MFTKSRLYLMLGAALLALPAMAGGAAVAQEAAAESFSPPRIGSDYTDALQELPDWTGWYRPAGGLMFDPVNFHVPEDPAGDLRSLDFGPLTGSYNTAIPYKAEYQEQYDRQIDQNLAGFSIDQTGVCNPHGFPRIMGGAPGPMEVIMLPDQVRLTWNLFNQTRRIYTDGRDHPSGDDFWPTWLGHSTGVWEGDTLVVDTVGVHGAIFDQSGAPYSDQMHVVERITMVEDGVLEVNLVMHDPVMFTEPYEVTRRFTRYAEDKTMVLGTYCDPQADVTLENGFQEIIIPAPSRQ